jgi:pilus assembly protein CpaF
MFTVVITEKSGDQKRLTFGEPEVTIGRVPGNDVVLPKGNVSKRHSRIVLKDNRFIVVDLKSTNGTYVNGRKITSPLVVKEGDKIYIGDFVLTLEGEASVGAASARAKSDLELSDHVVPPLPSRAPEPMPDDSLPAVLRGSSSQERPSTPANGGAPVGGTARHLQSVPPVIAEALPEKPPLEQTNVVAYGSEAEQDVEASLPSIPPPPLAPGAAAARAATPSVVRPAAPPVPGGTQTELRLLMLRVARDFDLDLADAGSTADERRWQKAERVILAKISELAGEHLLKGDRGQLAKAALHEAVGLGPLDALLSDPSVFHIVVERFDRVRADRGRGLVAESLMFSSPNAVLTIVRRLAAEAGVTGTLPESMDLSLPNGVHLVAMQHAAASEGPVVSIRRRPTQLATLATQKQNKVLDDAQLRAIQSAVKGKRSVWFVGPSSMELASLLASVIAECPSDERVALFERSPETALGERAAICLRLGSVPLSALVERVRYFRPDRLATHEPREEELPLLLSVFARRHDGSFGTLELKSAKEALTTLERAGGADLVLRAASLIVELGRTPTGPRVTGVFEPSVDATGVLTLTQA